MYERVINNSIAIKILTLLFSARRLIFFNFFNEVSLFSRIALEFQFYFAINIDDAEVFKKLYTKTKKKKRITIISRRSLAQHNIWPIRSEVILQSTVLKKWYNKRITP